MLELLALPFLACLILTGIHAYLGLHVLARGVIFVDLALAQVAALGLTLALLAGHPLQSDAAWWYALAFAVSAALLFAVTRVRRAPIPQEAIIGIVYAVSAARGARGRAVHHQHAERRGHRVDDPDDRLLGNGRAPHARDGEEQG